MNVPEASTSSEALLQGRPFGEHLDPLAVLASAESYRHCYLAVQAEFARREGRHGDVRELYDEALEKAAKSGFPFHEAVIAELAARYYEGREKAEMVAVYRALARDAYTRWGARAKTAAMDAEPRAPDVDPHQALVAENALEEATRAAPRALDAVAVVRAAQAIASEIDLERLIERLMRTLLELAGADHGALVLARDGDLMLEAVTSVDPEETRVGLSLPIPAAPDVAASIVQYVARARETLAITSPVDDPHFGRDARIEARKPASVLGFPLVHRGALAGVVYLENRLARGAFGKDRVEVLSLLSSQAAIAVENALLVADVRSRTNELTLLNAELTRELVERERAEAERAHLQQGIIAMQRARLAELRTPFIPVSDAVMVMPLVGTLDASRADEALEVALSGTASHGARVVIVDITGVKRVDEQVAFTLVRLVDSLRLLGAEAIVTGVRGEVARTLVGLDADFGAKVITKSTLEAGIRRALRRRRA